MKRRSGSSRLGCSLHPQEPTVGVCASCLRDRLGGFSAQKPEAKFQHFKSRVETSSAALDGDPLAQRIRRSWSFSESLRISGGTCSLRTAMQDEDSEHGTRSHTLLSLFRMDDMDSAAEEQEQLSCKNRPLDVDRRMQRKQLNARNGDGLVALSPPPPDQRKSKNVGKEQRNRAQKNSGKHAETEQNGAQRNSKSHAGNEQNRAQESRENNAEREQSGVQENSENHTEKEQNGEWVRAENCAEKEQQNRLKWNRVCTEAFHRRMRAFRSGRQVEKEQQHPKQVHNNNSNNNNNNNNSKSNSNNNITSSKQSAPPSPKYSMWSGYFNPVQTACKSSHSRKEESLERSRTISSLSPRNVENGLLRFYLTPLRTGKSRHRVRRTGVARGRNLWG